MSTIDKITDENGNVATIAYWGSEDAARASLATLNNCTNCVNCSDCSYCSDCSNCSRCSGCSNCSRCSDCSDCSYCSDCLRCSYCSHCSGCSNCSRCSYCSRCSHCSGCSKCSDCSDCSECSGKTWNSNDHIQPPIPKIENIHQAIYDAASQPGALDMSKWHCGTTHCRAGWVVALAGDQGKALEDYWTTNHAAWLIYKASDPDIEGRPDFFSDNETALADMQRLAEAEAARAALEGKAP